jgi:hypothetical protein
MFVDVISVSAMLYIINFANCYGIVVYGRLGTFYNFLMNALGKLLMFLVNYARYTTLFLLCKSPVSGALGGSERIMGISIISYGKNSLDLRPALANELIS